MLETRLTQEQRDLRQVRRGLGAIAAVDHRRHPRLLEDRGRQGGHRARAASICASSSRAPPELLAPRAHAKGIEIACHDAAGLPARLVGDPSRLRQILLNLVGNAIKFTRHGGVEIAARPAGDGIVEFRISDSGIGISPEDCAKVFDPYSQTVEGAERHYGGTGLGLSISQRLVERMGGDIAVESRQGEGSRFSFRVPLAAASDEKLPGAGALAGRVVHVAAPAGPTAETLVRQIGEFGAAVHHADTAARLARLLARPGAARPHAAPGDVPDIIVDSRFAAVVDKWLRKNTAGCERFHLWLLLQPEERRALRHLMIRPMTGYLLKPLRRATLLRYLGNREELLMARAAADLRDTAERGGKAGAGLNVLLAEDNEINAMLARAVVEKLGHRVVHLLSGKAVVEHMRAVLSAEPDAPPRPDLLLMDLTMPELNGIEAARRIRALEAEYHAPRPMPIMALTAHARGEDRRASLAAGMNGYLSKPFDCSELEDAIASLTSRAAA